MGLWRFGIWRSGSVEFFVCARGDTPDCLSESIIGVSYFGFLGIRSLELELLYGSLILNAEGQG